MHSQLLILLDGLVGGLFGAIFGLAYTAFFIAIIVGLWKMFEKAGKPGWTSLIPIYNLIVLQEIIGRELIKIILLLIPIVNIYFIITLYICLAKSFGKTQTSEFVLTVLFAPFYLGFGDARYIGPSEGPGTVTGATLNPF